MSLLCSMRCIEYIHSSIILIRPIRHACSTKNNRRKKALTKRAICLCPIKVFIIGDLLFHATKVRHSDLQVFTLHLRLYINSRFEQSLFIRPKQVLSPPVVGKGMPYFLYNYNTTQKCQFFSYILCYQKVPNWYKLNKHLVLLIVPSS